MRFFQEARLVPQGQPEIARDTGVLMARLRAGFDGVRAAWNARRRRARGVEQLCTFTDWELKDVGLCRSDLPSIADGTYRRN